MVTVDRRYRTVQLSLAVTFGLMEELLGLQLTAALPVFWPTGERWEVTWGWGRTGTGLGSH